MLSKLKKNRILLSLCLASCFTLAASTAGAMEQIASQDGQIILDFYNMGDTPEPTFPASTFTLNNWQKQHLLYAVNYWEQVLGASIKPITSVHITVMTIKNANASAYSPAKTLNAPGDTLGHTVLENALLGLTPSNGESVALIRIGYGLYPPTEAEPYFLTPVPQLSANKMGALANTMLHELGHALGVTDSMESNYIFADNITTPYTLYNNHLYDWRGIQAQPNMEIQTDYHKASSATYFEIPGNNETTAGYKIPYFSGDHVLAVLNGATLNTFASNGAKLDQNPVAGIPINGLENLGKSEDAELSHLELRNGIMSHQNYRNYFNFMEAELALLQDLDYTIDLRNSYGRSIYNSGLTLTNTDPYYARNADGTAYLTGTPNTLDWGVGLHIYGDNNTIYQASELLAGGRAAVGIRVDGVHNTVVVNKGSTVRADGLNGNGLLVAFGKNHDISLAPGSTVTALGEGGIGADFDFGVSETGYSLGARASYAARDYSTLVEADKVEVDGPLVSKFTVQGSLTGTKAAIYIGNTAYVQQITVGGSAQINGDILNNWLYDYDDILAYGNTTNLDYTKENSSFYRQYSGTDELTTKLSFANDKGMTYGGNITGQKNTRLSFDDGTTEYTGTAQVLSTDIAKGASLTGSGTFDLVTPDDNAAHTLSYRLKPSEAIGSRKLTGVGIFTNEGTLSPTTGNITINGDFISTGTLGAFLASQTQANAINVSGNAAITGSQLDLTAGSAKPLANRNYTYLTAGKDITGNAASKILSPYITLNSTVAGNKAYFTANNTASLGSLSGMSDSEKSLGQALNKRTLSQNDSAPTAASTQTLNSLLYQEDAASRATLKGLTSSDRSQLINVNPLSAMTTGAVYDRLDRALYDGNVNVAVPMNSFDGVPASMQVSTPVTLDLDHNFWFKLLRGFEYYGGTDGGYDLHNKSFGGVIGYDKAVNATTRLGGLFSYAKTDYNTDVLSGDSHDWRIGVYASHDNGTWKTQGMLSYGQNRYDFNRYIPYYGDKLSSDYNANIFDVDAKVTYLPQENRAKSWQVAPYGRLSYTHASQEAYTEEGSSVFAQDIDSASNSSFRAEAGVEWKHQMDKTSSWGGSVGYKRILSGANPELNGTFAGDTKGFTLSGDNDKNYVTYSVNLNKNTGNNWTVQGELRGEMSGHNHSEVYSLMAKHAF